MAERMPAALHAYRALTTGVSPLTPVLLSWRLHRGKEERKRLPERRAQTPLDRPPGPLVWIHGASVGEVIAATGLIERLDARGFRILLTSGTVTSAALAAQRMPPAVIHQFVPLDVPRYTNRFLDHWRPELVLLMESELWPNLILSAHRRGIPLVLVNGRLSDTSFRRWRRLPRTIAALLRRFDLCLAQSQEDARRYAALGAQVSITGNLKIDVSPPPAEPTATAALESAVAGRTPIAAASTHPGEESLLFAIHRQLRARTSKLLTMIAPRHPERGPEIAAAAEAAGLTARLHSRGEAPDAESDIYILDAVGVLGMLYRVAPIVFMGGSLVPHGGQNPIEPAKLGAAIVHGPQVWNFAEIYAALDDAAGARQVADAAGLAAILRAWLGDPSARQQVAQSGQRTIEGLGGALERTLAALDPYLPSLPLKPGQQKPCQNEVTHA